MRRPNFSPIAVTPIKLWPAYRTLLLLGAVAAGLCHSAARAEDPAPAAGPSGYHLDATWRLGGEGGWDCLTIDPDAHRLYIARQNRVQVVDTEKGTLAGEVPGVDGAHAVALVPELGRGYATCGKSNTVVVFDLKTLAPVGSPIPVGKKPDIAIYDPASKHVLVCDADGDDFSVLDPAVGKVIATVALGGAPEFAVSDGKGTVYVNLEDKSETLAVDMAKNAVVQRWPLAPGEAPTGLGLDDEKHRLFAACHNQKMVVLDAGTGKVISSLPIGQGVDGAAFDAGTRLAFSPNGEGTLTVIGENAAGEPQVLENVKTRRGARTMALDPKTHAVYLAAADFEAGPSPAPGEKPKRPPMVPNSFVILKFVR